VLSAVSLAMMMSPLLIAQQITPVAQPTIVPMVGQVTLSVVGSLTASGYAAGVVSNVRACMGWFRSI
jgi:hypothetical protein